MDEPACPVEDCEGWDGWAKRLNRGLAFGLTGVASSSSPSGSDTCEYERPFCEDELWLPDGRGEEAEASERSASRAEGSSSVTTGRLNVGSRGESILVVICSCVSVCYVLVIEWRRNVDMWLTGFRWSDASK